MMVEVIGRSWEGGELRVVTVGNRSASYWQMAEKLRIKCRMKIVMIQATLNEKGKKIQFYLCKL